MMRALIQLALITTMLFVLYGGILYAAMPAVTQQASEQTKKDESRAKTQSTVPDTASIRLDNIEIQGRVEKPQTVFILPGKDPEVDTIQIDRSFFREIFRKVERDMLQRTSR